MKHVVPGVLALALAACGRAPTPVPAEAGPEPSFRAAPGPAVGGTPIVAVGGLTGEYRVAAIDGEPLDEPVGMAVSIDGPRLSFEPVCAGFAWRIAFEEGRLVTVRDLPGTGPAVPPAPACAATVHPVQRRLAEALDAAQGATRTPDNGIVLSGGGRSVTLFSQ